MLNKRASGASTLTWIIAMFVIALASLIFILGTIAISAKRYVNSDEDSIVFTDSYQNDLIIQKSLESFLNKKVNYQNKEITISSLIANYEDDESARLFKQNAEAIFSKIFPSSWQITLSSIDQSAQSEANKKFNVGSSNCDPADSTKSIVFLNYVENKRLTLCILKSPYGEWKNAKYK